MNTLALEKCSSNLELVVYKLLSRIYILIISFSLNQVDQESSTTSYVILNKYSHKRQ